jgi:hypothetical protein
MGVFSSFSDELAPVSDSSNSVTIIGELCLKPPLNAVRVCIFLEEKLNDHSLLVLHPAVKI